MKYIKPFMLKKIKDGMLVDTWVIVNTKTKGIYFTSSYHYEPARKTLLKFLNNQVRWYDDYDRYPRNGNTYTYIDTRQIFTI